MTVSDADLLAQHVRGSPTAFGELVHRHRDRLWAVALRTVGNPEDAEDVVQEAVVKAFRHAEEFRGDAAVATWLHRITVNTALDALRSAARRPQRSDLGVEPVDPRDHLGSGEQRLDVRAALAQIPDDQRAAVVLVDMLGLSIAETASLLEVAPGTVKSRCFRGRARLASILSAYAPATTAVQGNPGPSDDVQPADGSSAEPSREEP